MCFWTKQTQNKNKFISLISILRFKLCSKLLQVQQSNFYLKESILVWRKSFKIQMYQELRENNNKITSES